MAAPSGSKKASGFTVSQFKSLFFRAGSHSALDPIIRAKLLRFGGMVRLTARRSMRRRKGNKTAAPGTPPFAHVGLLKEFMFFAYDDSSKSVVIGPAKLNQKVGNAPEALEYGGQSLILKTQLKRGRAKKGEPKNYSTYKVNIRPHPYMAPAFKSGQKQLARIFKV